MGADCGAVESETLILADEECGIGSFGPQETHRERRCWRGLGWGGVILEERTRERWGRVAT